MSNEGTARRAILRVWWGPMAYHKAIIEPDQVLRVGRAEFMGLALPQDEHMAAHHFELFWRGSQCWLKDLGSNSGTFLGGSRVGQGELSNGSWVRAGRTDFMVYFEGATPARVLDTPEPPALVARKLHALEVLRSQELPLFAILDSARDERILVLLQESVEEFRSLYEGTQGQALAEVAPYLVALPKDSRLLEALVEEGWGHSWGVYLTCSLPFQELRRHFRKLLMVKAEGFERRLYFRCYDPRVLRPLLEMYHPSQKAMLFGDVERYLLEGKDQEVLCLKPEVGTGVNADTPDEILIEKRQLDLLGDELMATFVSRVSQRIRQDFQNEALVRGMEPSSLEQFVRSRVDDARNHGVVQVLDVEYFITCCVVLGPDFYQQEKYGWATEILNDKDWDGTMKMKRIAQRLSQAVREQET